MSDRPKIYRNPRQWLQHRRNRPVVTVLRLEGVIAPGRGTPLRPGSLNMNALQSMIDQAFKPSRLTAVALQVNSPGGSPVQSALISDAIRRRAEEKKVPVLAFAEDVAASGGYWLLAAGDEVFAHSASVVGSIGVISASFGFQELIQRYGIERRIHTAGEKKVMMDPFSPEKEEDVARLHEIQKQIHEQFMDHVKARRGDKLNRRRYKEMFSGEIFLGAEAQRMGLIDELGDMDSVLRARFGKDLVLKRLTPRSSPIRRLLGGASAPDLAAQAASEIEARTSWGRFGL
ncbi:MAG: S49 family peptidase [Minwuia sp.]|uniref:S49 family peptidase n=1 Tax=Minwuia sp. TaxID=2493630 RepID=UPI003A888C7A